MFPQTHPQALQQHRGYPMAPLSLPPGMGQPGPHYPIRSEPVTSPLVEDQSPPKTLSQLWDNKIWTLRVEQQPIRARMCGFGDKVLLLPDFLVPPACADASAVPQDRRPITPPPCIKLSVVDALTHKDVDMKFVPLRASGDFLVCAKRQTLTICSTQ